MKISGEYHISAARETVWQALNDPLILQQSIPGCQELEKISDTELQAKIMVKIGPVKAKFAGTVQLEDLVPPESYSIVGEGKGGVAGFAKGRAEVRLEEDGGQTKLIYAANAQVGGKLAQIGSRLIDSATRKMADEFFGKFAELISTPSDEAVETDGESGISEAADAVSPPPSQHPAKDNAQSWLRRPAFWIALGAGAMVILILAANAG